MAKTYTELIKTLHGNFSLLAGLILINCIQFLSGSFSKTTLAFWLDSNYILLWDYQTNAPIVTLGPNYPGGYLVFTNDGRLAYSASNYQIFVYNETSATSVILGKDAFSIEQMSHGYLATSGGDQSLYFWDMKTQQSVQSIGLNNGKTINFLRELKSLSYLAAAMSDFSITLWNITTYNMVQTLNGHTTKITVIEDLGNRKLISAAVGGSVIIWNSILDLSSFRPFEGGAVNCLKVLASDLAVVGGLSSKVSFLQISNTNQMSIVRNITLPQGVTQTFDLGITSSQQLFMSFNDGLLGLYDLTTWTYINTINVCWPKNILYIQVYDRFNVQNITFNGNNTSFASTITKIAQQTTANQASISEFFTTNNLSTTKISSVKSETTLPASSTTSPFLSGDYGLDNSVYVEQYDQLVSICKRFNMFD